MTIMTEVEPNLLDQLSTRERVHTASTWRIRASKPKKDQLDGAIERIRSLGDERAKIGPEDVYTFEMYAASDGVDSYFTQQDLESSLKPMSRDLAKGQALLGNHSYGTYAIGSSYGARVEKLDQSSASYEPTFFGEPDNESMRATNGLLGEYFVGRGLRLNGEETDSIIRSIELGQARKASITFVPESYVCGLDGLPMILAAYAALAADGGEERAARFKRHETAEPEPECFHFPGVRYEDGTAWAVMHGSTVLETSLVYKNSSPSALFKRVAALFSSRGVLSRPQAAQVEVTLGMRMPGFEQRLWTPGEETTMKPEKRTESETTTETTTKTVEPQPEPPPPPPPTETETTTTTKVEQAPETTAAPTVAARIVEDFESAASAVRSAIAAELLQTEELERIARAEAEVDASLAGRSVTGIASAVGRAAADAAWSARSREAEEALGRPVTASAIRSLRVKADAFEEYFDSQVGDTIATRNGLGVQYDVEQYRGVLKGSDSIAFVKAEKASYEELKGRRFAAGRQTQPGPLRPEVAPRRSRKTEPVPAVTGSEPNLLERFAHSGE